MCVFCGPKNCIRGGPHFFLKNAIIFFVFGESNFSDRVYSITDFFLVLRKNKVMNICNPVISSLKYIIIFCIAFDCIDPVLSKLWFSSIDELNFL